MQKKTVLVFTFMLIGTLIVFIPNALALTWSITILQQSLGDPFAGSPVGGGTTGIGAFDENKPITTYFAGGSGGNDFRSGRSTDTGGSYSLTTISSTGDVGRDSDIFVLNPTTAYACYGDITNVDTYFTMTSTSGLFWSTPILVNNANNYECEIFAHNSSTIDIVIHDASLLIPRITRSTDGGLTWSAPVLIVNVAGFVSDIAVKDSNTMIVSFGGNGNVYRTTDGGATWSSGIPLGGSQVSDIAHVSGDFFIAVSKTATTGEVLFSLSTNGGTIWSGATAFTHIEAVSNAQIIDIDSDSYAIFYSEGAVALQTTLLRKAQTEDGGATWTHETIATSTGNEAVISGMDAILVNGRFYVSYKATECRGCGGTDEQWSMRVATAQYAPAITNLVSPTATVAVTALTSFDVDRSGTVLVTRTNSGDFVRTFETKDGDGTLEQLGSQETNCLLNDGVVATEAAIAFLACTGTHGTDPDVLLIRGFGGTPFNQPSFADSCDETDECLTSIELDGGPFCTGFADDDEQLQIDDFQAIPFDYSTFGTEVPFNEDLFSVAWAYSSSDKFVGVSQFTTRAGCDGFNTDRQLFGAAIPGEICSWTTDGEEAQGNLTGSFIGATEFSSSTKLYRYTPALDENNNLNGDLSTATTYTGLSQGIGIACATDYALIGRATTTNNVVLLDTFSGQNVWTKTVEPTTFPNRPVAMSFDGQIVGYHNDGNFCLAHRFDGIEFGCVEPPAGTWVGAKFDFNAQNLWICTATNCAWYDLEQNFPEDIPGGCVGFNCEPGATSTPTPTVGPDLIGQSGAAFDEIFGVGKGVIILGIIWTLALTAIGFYIGGFPVAAIGFVIGFASSAVMNMFPEAMVFIIIVISILAIVALIKR